MSIPEKRYIGDAVYVQFDGYHVVLTTSDGIRNTNTISLEPSVITSFEEYMEDLRKAFKELSK